jgi:O-methyltransferase
MRIRKFLKDTYYTYFNPSSELPFSIQRPPNSYELDIIAKVKPYTMTSPERITALIRSVDYVLKNNIPGDFVECGVWKGGNIMVMMEVLKKHNTTREIYLYDTFEGMSEATDLDVSTTGKIASELLAKNDKSEEIWCYSPLEEVQELLSKTGYPNELLHYVKGKVEDTLPTTSPNEISLLRLDTDWYESTKIEMEVLYPKLKSTGIFISDDYGYWEGCRTAIDEYFNVKKLNEKMHKIDKAGYLNLKKSK